MSDANRDELSAAVRRITNPEVSPSTRVLCVLGAVFCFFLSLGLVGMGFSDAVRVTASGQEYLFFADKLPGPSRVVVESYSWVVRGLFFLGMAVVLGGFGFSMLTEAGYRKSLIGMLTLGLLILGGSLCVISNVMMLFLTPLSTS